jgi:hypothetical protein
VDIKEEVIADLLATRACVVAVGIGIRSVVMQWDVTLGHAGVGSVELAPIRRPTSVVGSISEGSADMALPRILAT